MLLFPPSLVGGLLAATVATTTISDSSSPPATVPVLEVIKVYGKMAGDECYGTTAPKGSCCQITLSEVERKFHLDDGNPVLTLDEFQNDLDAAEFKWPLKPYGVDKSLSKTATMNKGAETRVFMKQLEERGLYDKRNPAGPLPTSLRPQLNAILQREGVDRRTTERVFGVLGGTGGELSTKKLREKFSARAVDYYDFIDMIGKEMITWPY
jgi:hypothetical protein